LFRAKPAKIVHDRLLLDHSPEADLLDLGAVDSGRNGLLLSTGGARGQQGASACENCGKQQGNTISGRPHTALLLCEVANKSQRTAIF
jgi:hypothetical protein